MPRTPTPITLRSSSRITSRRDGSAGRSRSATAPPGSGPAAPTASSRRTPWLR
jgi:hypothetical protein